MPVGDLHVTGLPDDDALLNTDGLALLIGMLLDQQVPMEWAFRGPTTLKARLGGELDATQIATMDTEALVAVFCKKPALHRFPANMARRTHDLCRHIVETYQGSPERIWAGVADGAELFDRLHGLPGFGEEKAQIFVAILGKRMGVRPKGWREAAGVFGDEVMRSVADIDGPDALAQVREFKKAMKASNRDKQGRPQRHPPDITTP
jgi:uncharacterized HhH-GPD family protein